MPPSKSSRMMTSLNGGECHNLTMKIVGCNPHVTTSKAATLMWCPSDLDECHDVTEEDGASTKTPHKVCTEEKARNKQDKDHE